MTDRRPHARLLLPLCGAAASIYLCVLAVPVSAEPPPPAAATAPPPAPVPAPDVVWQNVEAAYRAGPVAERVRVGVLTPKPLKQADPTLPPDPDRLALEDFLRAAGPDADERRGVVFFRTAPTAAGHRVVRLEMGDLRVYAEPGVVTAVRQSVPGGVVVKTFDGAVTPASFDRLMPPLLLPQLSLALSEPGIRGSFMPGLPPVEWETSQRVKEGTLARIILRGRTQSARGDHRVEAAVDESTFRLVRVKITTPQLATAPSPAAGDVVLELFMTPIDPGDVGEWRISTDGRVAVESIDKLRSAPPPTPAPASTTLKVRDQLPQLHLCNARTEAWGSEKSPQGMLAGLVPDDASEFRAALLLHVPARDAGARQHLARARQVLASAASAAAKAPDSAHHAIAAGGVALLEFNGFDAARRSALRDWTTPADATNDQPLLCSPAGPAALEQFSSPPGPVIVVVDQKLSIRALVAIPREGETAAAIDAISAALSQP